MARGAVHGGEGNRRAVGRPRHTRQCMGQRPRRLLGQPLADSRRHQLRELRDGRAKWRWFLDAYEKGYSFVNDVATYKVHRAASRARGDASTLPRSDALNDHSKTLLKLYAALPFDQQRKIDRVLADEIDPRSVEYHTFVKNHQHWTNETWNRVWAASMKAGVEW